MINLTQVQRDTPVGVEETMQKVCELRHKLESYVQPSEEQTLGAQEMLRQRSVFFTQLNDNVIIQSSNEATLLIRYKDYQITKIFIGLVNIGGLPEGTRVTVIPVLGTDSVREQMYKATLVDGYWKRPGEVRKEDLKW